MKTEQYISARNILEFKKNIRIISTGCAGGSKEKDGPLGRYLDKSFDNPLAGKDSFEKAESLLCRTALDCALKKAGLCDRNIDILLAGDLLNQCSGSGYGL